MYVLDQFQIDAISDIKGNNNVLVVAPTGSGKTLIAEKSIDFYLEKNKNIFYTTPIKALSNQKYNDFKKAGVDVGLLTGDRTIDKDKNLIIATTEILRNMIFSKDKKLENTGLIILDEVHYLGDTERGTTWEEILIHADLGIKFLCLSATVKNKNEFLEWIVSLRGPTSLIQNNQRPVPLEISLITTNKLSNSIKILKSTNKKKDNNNSKLSKLTQNVKKPSLDEQVNFLEDQWLTPCIFFHFSRERVESKARQLANNRKVVDDHKLIRDKFYEIFDDLDLSDHTLLNLDEHLWMWSRGVAFHHAGLAPIVKEFIEFLFLNKYINFLFATETLALGINMPAKSIYLDRLNKYDGIKSRLISRSEFLQLTGRAGRRGIDDKGYAFLSFDKNINPEWYSNLFTLESSNLNSAFSINYFSILNLLNIYSADECIEILNKSFFAFQNSFNIDSLKNAFNSKLKVLEDINFINTSMGETLIETHRDQLIPSIYLYNKIKSVKTFEFYLMFVSSGISSNIYDVATSDEFDDLLSYFESSLEILNKLENKHSIKKFTNLNLTWFSIFYEFYKTNNIEYVVTKFNINIGDFIKAAKEGSELSKKLFNIYQDQEFEAIYNMFDNNLIQKSMS
tara:strand:- start:2690 stop:4558 length:1869 start_codon:yes stop_codon:yes gene_type:complete